jgi:hypothetical protein
MLNRVGSKGWGPSKDIYDVATAPGQYEAYWKFRGMKVPEDRANFIRDRLKAVASGEVADPTHGANSYRADSYAFGEGRSREWMRKYGQYGVSVGGNRFAKITDPGLSGPFASHEADPAARTSSAAPSMVRPSLQDASGSSLRQVGNYRQGVDPRLTEILNAASKDSPYKVEAFSGYRPGDPRFHGQGKATDIRLVDRETGKALANYQTAGSFREYEKFAQHAREIQQQTHPELDKQFRWGGYFGGGRGKYGAMDEMHFDLGGSNRLGMAGGSWEKGLTPEQRRRFAGVESVGMASARPSPMQMASARPDPQTLARPDPASFAKSDVGGQPTNVQLGRGMIDVRLKLDKDLKMSMPKVTPGSQFDLGVNVDRTGQFFSRPGDPSVPIFGGSSG